MNARVLSKEQIIIAIIIILIAVVILICHSTIKIEDPQCQELKEYQYSAYLFIGLAMIWVASCGGAIKGDNTDII